MSRKCLLFCILLIITFPLVVFSQPDRWRGQIKIIDGIPHIINPNKGLQPDLNISFEKVLEIGSEEGDENYIFEAIVDADVDDEGRIYILDYQACNLRIFSPQGQYLRTIGRPGKGPGEFTYPVAVSIIGRDTIAVVEATSHRFSFFDRNGTLLRDFKINFLGGITKAKALSRGQFLVTQSILERKENRSFMNLELNIIDDRGQKICQISKKQRDITNILQRKKISQKKTPVIFWCVDKEGNIFVIDDIYDYKIKVFDQQGKLLRVIERQFKLLKKSKEEIEKERQAIEATRKRIGINTGMKVEIAKVKPIIGTLCVDERNRLWVSTPEGAPESGLAFDIFDPKGRYLNKITAHFRPTGYILIKGGFLYFPYQNQETFPKFYKYRIVEH